MTEDQLVISGHWKSLKPNTGQYKFLIFIPKNILLLAKQLHCLEKIEPMLYYYCMHSKCYHGGGQQTQQNQR